MLTREDVYWQRGPNERVAYKEVKRALSKASFLTYLDPKLPHGIMTDAIGVELSRVLMQYCGQGPQLLEIYVGA